MIKTSQTTTLLPYMEFGTQRQWWSKLYFSLLVNLSRSRQHYCGGSASEPYVSLWPQTALFILLVSSRQRS